MTTQSKPCWVNMDGGWVKGTLLKWERREDGFQGIVSVMRDGAPEIMVKPARDLRERKPT